MRFYKILIGVLFFGWNVTSYAYYCPDPNTTSLQWGVPPEPWVVNPYSANKPQGEANTKFVRANILVAGSFGKGVVCTYKNSVGEYSIWWDVLTKIPPKSDNHWIDTLGGLICTQVLNDCEFFAAS